MKKPDLRNSDNMVRNIAASFAQMHAGEPEAALVDAHLKDIGITQHRDTYVTAVMAQLQAMAGTRPGAVMEQMS